MLTIFLDESGDLGFDLSKQGTSRFFVMTFLCCESKRRIEKIVSETHAELKNRYKKQGGVLHACYERPVTRQRLLGRLGMMDCLILTVYLDKTLVSFGKELSKAQLYSSIASSLLDDLLSREPLGDVLKLVTLIASRRETNAFLNEGFKNYLISEAWKKHRLEIRVEIRTTFEEKALQAVDFVSWAIFHKLEYGEDLYYRLIQPRIVSECALSVKRQNPARYF